MCRVAWKYYELLLWPRAPLMQEGTRKDDYRLDHLSLLGRVRKDHTHLLKCWFSLRLWDLVRCFCYKSDKQITKNDKGKRNGNTRFNYKTPFNIEGEKPRTPTNKYFTISESVYKRRWLSYNLINSSWRLTKCIYRRRRTSLHSSGVSLPLLEWFWITI
jgi:hypothetical protein